MKKRILFGVWGFGLAAGTTVYMLLKHKNKGTSDNQNEEALDISIAENTESFNEVKEQSIMSISNRHKDAAEIIRQAMEKINDNSEVVSKHKNEFDSMLNDLDKL